MEEWLEFLRVSLSFFFLAVSSWYDFKTREVPNRLWVLFAPAGFALTLLQFYFNLPNVTNTFPVSWLISFGVTTGISLALFYLGLFGGADAKALICLSIALPVYPSLARHYIEALEPLFPLAVLSNAVLGSSLLVIAITGHNLVKLAQNGGRMFEGLESEPFWSKILAFTTGFKVDSGKLKQGSHYMPLEHFSRGTNGEIIRHFRIAPRLQEEATEENSSPDDLFITPNAEIWVTPGLPFLVFVTAGFIAAIFIGDFVSWLIAQLVVAMAL